LLRRNELTSARLLTGLRRFFCFTDLIRAAWQQPLPRVVIPDAEPKQETGEANTGNRVAVKNVAIRLKEKGPKALVFPGVAKVLRR